jgi:membrane-bound serine protease (ClpP class)
MNRPPRNVPSLGRISVPFRAAVPLIAFLIAVAIPVLPGGAGAADGPVYRIRIDGVISPGTADFLHSALAEAAAADAECFIIVLDTPGGLEASMRDMVTDIMDSSVPVVVYVAPSGARAASAGAFITLAANVAAMAPGTNIGAAHPVQMGGGDGGEEMAKKVGNDAAAFMRSIAQQRGRNVEWAERAVLESISASAEEALEANVIDLVVPSMDDLLAALDGREVPFGDGSVLLSVAGKPVKDVEMGFRDRMLRLLSDPNVAYIFLILGFYGILFELSNPGAILPGVVGGIFIILAFFALQTLPVNYAGLLLILFALVLFIAEIKVTSYGLLTVGGVASLVLGSILLFDSSAPFLRVSWMVLVPVLIVTVGFVLLALSLSIRTHRHRPTTGDQGMVGLAGVAVDRLAPGVRGKVKVRGEIWWAECAEEIGAGEKIHVLGSAGSLTLRVRKLN